MTDMTSATTWSLGSRWLRWDPHLHTPGTLRNDQFGEDWEPFLRRLEEAQPQVVALGVTDYFCLNGYKTLRTLQDGGALGGVFLFPNIEIRLTIETERRQGINVHLLVSPDDPEHVARIEEKLATLHFPYRGEKYQCTEAGLKRLGRAHKGNPGLDDFFAMCEGANQFKVDFNNLRELRDSDSWIQDNVLFAVAAGNDGLAGIAKDSSFRALREELGRFADIIFSGQPTDREYWLGRHRDFEANGQSPKPCLHGCDAHKLNRVLEPDLGRLCWIRAEPSFNGLRQTLVEPERRVYVGEEPPPSPSPSNAIRAFRVRNASWFPGHDLLLNDGLVTIIGSRGSGKTALADLIAAATYSLESDPGPASFVRKAESFLDGVEVEVEWGDGTSCAVAFPCRPNTNEPRARYLSQQFVEHLCAPERLAQPLIEEMERIVFAAIPEEDRLETASFDELRTASLSQIASVQEDVQKTIHSETRRVGLEANIERGRPDLEKRFKEAERQRIAAEKELADISAKKGAEERGKALEKVNDELNVLQQRIARAKRRIQNIGELENAMRAFDRETDETMTNWKSRFTGLFMDSEWDQLRPRLPDDAYSTLRAREKVLVEEVKHLSLNGLNSPEPPNFVCRGLATLREEHDRLTKELGIDAANAKRHAELTKSLVKLRGNEEKARLEVDEAAKAPQRRALAHTQRLSAYERLFHAFDQEMAVLKELYAPLSKRLTGDPSLSKLSFNVHRTVDVTAWAAQGERLLDLRRRTSFQGRGSIEEAARAELLQVWLHGTPAEVRAAFETFYTKHARAASDNLAQGVTLLEFGEWLFSTAHVRVRYGVQYEGVDLNRLSPGTRGVVLLMLYLALDEHDPRPLIIDQPEENLDPQSVYRDLLGFFRAARRRRQIIMVTHNANLVVNTDSDQVIVARGERTSSTGLPTITYEAGGLEDARIRGQVCALLEGGEEAFRRRGMRYGVHRSPRT